MSGDAPPEQREDEARSPAGGMVSTTVLTPDGLRTAIGSTSRIQFVMACGVFPFTQRRGDAEEAEPEGGGGLSLVNG